jgi:hypothetical protein
VRRRAAHEVSGFFASSAPTERRRGVARYHPNRFLRARCAVRASTNPGKWHSKAPRFLNSAMRDYLALWDNGRSLCTPRLSSMEISHVGKERSTGWSRFVWSIRQGQPWGTRDSLRVSGGRTAQGCPRGHHSQETARPDRDALRPRSWGQLRCRSSAFPVGHSSTLQAGASRSWDAQQNALLPTDRVNAVIDPSLSVRFANHGAQMTRDSQEAKLSERIDIAHDAGHSRKEDDEKRKAGKIPQTRSSTTTRRNRSGAANWSDSWATGIHRKRLPAWRRGRPRTARRPPGL